MKKIDTSKLESFPIMRQGDYFSPLVFGIDDPANPGTELDLTGYSVLMQLRERPEGPIIHTFDISVRVPSITKITINGFIISFEPNDYLTDLMITDPDGKIGHSNMLLFPVEAVISVPVTP